MSPSPGDCVLATESGFDDVAWYRATTLAERIAAASAPGDGPRITDSDQAVAARRLHRWRSEPPFTKELLFAQRLAVAGIGEEQFLALLGEPPEGLRARLGGSPRWLVQLASVFGRNASSPALPLDGSLRGGPEAGFLHVFEPLVADAVARLRAAAEKLLRRVSAAPFRRDSLQTIFEAELERELLSMASRTLVLELNVARLQGLLAGESPEDRFRSFADRLRRSDVRLGILREYPVLARQVVGRIDQWVESVVEFLERLCEDWEAIRLTFSPDREIGTLARVNAGAGDRHRNGRSVVVAEFTSGFRIVYKPRSVGADTHFQRVIAWFNQRGLSPALRTIRTLDRDTHGWIEYVAGDRCSADSVSDFYRRQGAYLMLLHLLGASDVHCENLIAAGEQPVVVDLEALFHAAPPRARTEWRAAGITTIENSVLAVGLLPQRVDVGVGFQGADLSGLGGAAGQTLPYPLPTWERAGTDEMRLARKPATTLAAANRLWLDGADVNPCDHEEEIVAGFTETYRLVMKHRDELLSPEGPLSWFVDDEVRVILRATQTYAVLLGESFHPDLLRDALDRDLLFDRLWTAVEAFPYLARVISAEREDLDNGDIPIFTTRPATRTLWTSSGRAIEGFFDEPPLALVRRRLEGLGECDLERQAWFVRASLSASAERRQDSSGETLRPTNTAGAIGREELLSAARAAGDALVRLGIRSNEETSWIGLVAAGEQPSVISPLGIDLYDGLSGVALFLAYLGAVTGERRFAELARQTGDTIVRRIRNQRAFITSIGAYSGWGGVIYALGHLGALWGKAELLDEAEGVVGTLSKLLEKDEELDIIGGAAGCIGALLSLLQQRPSKAVEEVAVRCGEHLIARAQRQEHGFGWIVRGQVSPLTGFAHGAAGIAWALLKLATAKGDERFRTMALNGVEYERSQFSAAAGNWRVPGRDSYATTWCYGAPGIGLARLSSLEQREDLTARAEIDTAIATTLDDGFGQNHSLCHGDLGNAELVLQATRTLDDPRWQREVSRVSSYIAESLAHKGYLCGTPSRVPTPGLMTGLAGIGYGLLRLAAPERVPSVLTLEPPLEG